MTQRQIFSSSLDTYSPRGTVTLEEVFHSFSNEHILLKWTDGNRNSEQRFL